MLTAEKLKPGTVFETMQFNTPSGNYYKVIHHDELIGKVFCRNRFEGRKVVVHPECKVRVVQDIEGF